MSISPVITVKNLSKIYKLYEKPIDRLKETFHPLKKQYHRDFYALRDISFEVGKGEVLGLIGRNGCGKSTVLQLICGVLTPSSGTIEAYGRISALLELGAGFNPELTGLENVYFKSSILGDSKSETEAKIDDILDFADIGDFIHQPVKTYSSGMFIRLAFAVAVNVDPDILVVDEALSVGDFRFKQKCLRKIKKFREDDKTILFVSHDTNSVIEFCTKAIWLKDGKICMAGKPADVCKEYISFMSYGEISTPKMGQELRKKAAHNSVALKSTSRDLPWVDISSMHSFGKGGAFISRMTFCRADDLERIDTFAGGERVLLALEIAILKDVHNPIVGFIFSDIKGINIIAANSQALGKKLGAFTAGEHKVVEFEFNFPLLKVGSYSFSPAIAESDGKEDVEQQHWVHNAYLLRIANKDPAAHLGQYLVLKEGFDFRLSSF